MENKIMIYIGLGILALLLLGSILATVGVFNKKSISSISSGNSSFSPDTPKECRPPEGQDINSWKEHLGHHNNTKYCLQYYLNSSN